MLSSAVAARWLGHPPPGLTRRAAVFFGPVGEWISHQTFNLVIAGSNPAGVAMLWRYRTTASRVSRRPFTDPCTALTVSWVTRPLGAVGAC